MRATVIGHATLLVEGGGVALVMDPLFAPTGERTVEMCPRRIVHREAFPPIDAIIVSHFHGDHLDPESLRTLPRSAAFFCPPDERITAVARRLGFGDVRILEPQRVVRLGALELFPTGSAASHPELGVVFHDADGSIWNQADCGVTQRTRLEVRRFTANRLDGAFCVYNPILEHTEMWVDECEFPRVRYEYVLEAAIGCGAHTLVPGSSGECCTGDRAWLNPRLFPISRQRFARDVNALAPELEVMCLDPGEALGVANGQATREITPFAETVDPDTSEIRFAPTPGAIPPWRDYNPQRFALREMQGFIRHAVETLWPLAASRALGDGIGGPLRRIFDRRATLQIEVTLPHETLAWHVARWRPSISIERLAHPDPDYVYQFLGSELFAYATTPDAVAPRVRARRRRSKKPLDGRFALRALSPARLSGLDPIVSVDETYDWHPLELLADVGQL